MFGLGKLGAAFGRPMGGSGVPLAPGDLRGNLFLNDNSFFTSLLSTTYPTSGDFFQNDNTFFTAAVALASGNQNINGALFQNSPSFLAATIALLSGTQNIDGALFQNSSSFLASTVANASFDPLSVGPSLLIDPSDTATMFQLITGATTVTDGSVCGFAGDKSGAAFDLSAAANDTTRPTWVNNSGFPYISFDGTNDVLRRTTALGLYAGASGNSVFLAIRSNTPLVNNVLVGDTNTGDVDTLYTIMADSVTASTMRARVSNDAGTTEANVSRTTAFDNSDRVIGFTDDKSNIVTYLDQSASSPTGYTRSGVHTHNRFCLGADITSVTTFFWPGRVYGMVIVPRVMNSTEIANVVTWLGAKQNRVI